MGLEEPFLPMSPDFSSEYPDCVTPPTMRPSGRFCIERRDEDLWIFIGPRRNWGESAFLSFWLCGWIVGELLGIFCLIKVLLETLESIIPVLFMILWLGGWTFGGVMAIYTFAAELWRWRETYVSRKHLYQRVRIGAWKRETLIDLDSIQEVRISTSGSHPMDWSSSIEFGRRRMRGVAVQYGEKKTLLLVFEDYNPYSLESSKSSESLVEQTCRVLEDFRIPVVP